MATLQKEKPKRKKKAKEVERIDVQNKTEEEPSLKSHIDAETENPIQNEQQSLSEDKDSANTILTQTENVKVDTNSSDDALANQCEKITTADDAPKISSNQCEEITSTDDAPKTISDSCGLDEAIGVSQAISSPSAPVIENLAVRNENLKTSFKVEYPDLHRLQITSNKLQDTAMLMNTKAKLTVPNPMTKSQLEQLYDCKILDLVKQFELDFLANSLQQNFDNDPLYACLQQYAVSRSKIKVNFTDFEDLQKEFQIISSGVWKKNIETEEGSSTCIDNVRVYAKESYEIINIDQTEMQSLALTLSKMSEIICFSYNTNKMNAENARLKIEQIIREILSHPCFNKIDAHTVHGTNAAAAIDPTTLQGLTHLRRALSILFSCLRKPSPDIIFYSDLKQWICTLVAAYLKIATLQDHWFLLFHILRCPSGISTWATSFIQISEPQTAIDVYPMESLEINHCLSILHILLMPIKKRNEFLSALSRSHREISDPVKDDVWILVDSDGEEGSNYRGECVGLKENDLISFLNQIPLEMIFRCIINGEKNGSGDYVIANERITETQFLKLIAFNTKLVELFGDGLLTYNNERYKQFAKRLGRLIRHTIHYVSDIHEIFLKNKLSKDPFLCEQITVEMNAFIVKSCSYIYKTPNLATWQYFSSLPFALLESDTMWQLFLYLNVGFPNDFPVANEDFKNSLNHKSFWASFNLAVADLSPEDLYYLLQTFFEMANERDRIKDWEFIETICLHIFLIGFVNEGTRETCYKTSRDMLTNLTLSYPELIASLLQQMRIRFKEAENLIYLVKSLPLENWKTDIQSFEVLSLWLLNYNYDCKENALARIIISHLNWGFDTDKRLFLPHNIHVRMACLVCEALNKHIAEVVGSSTISESMRQVSNLIENHSNREQFTMWCWNMVSLLRLHLMDQNSEAIRKTLQNPSDHLCFVPELENFEIIYQGVSENRPLALYISVLISLWGHSIPLICQKGIPQMKLLLLDHRYICVIRCIQLITPLFLESPDTLASCEIFQEVLKNIFNADRTYLKIAKDFVLSNAHGPVFEHFINMMQSQIIHYYETGLTTPSLFIHLWLEILSSYQNWQNTNVVFLIDAILKIAYQFSDSWGNCKEFFREYFKNCPNWKFERSSTFKMLLGSSNQNKYFPTLSTDCGWLALLLLELEHESVELKNNLWPEFLRNLLHSNEKSIEITLKKSCTAVGCAQFAASSLVLYKYANLIANADINHPLLAIFGQNFFQLYLTRVTFGSSNEERFQNIFAVSDKFYEFNLPLMKKMKAKLKAAEENYGQLAHEHANNEALAYFNTQCAKIMKTYLLWLEETNIQKINRNQRMELPPQYNAEKLFEILNGHEQQHWTEFIYLRKIRDQQKQASNAWLKFCFRLHETKQRCGEILQSKQQINPIERIKNHLRSYDKPQPPPTYQKLPLIFEPLHSGSINSSTLDELRKELKYIDKFCKDLDVKFTQIGTLNDQFKEQIRMLYKNVPYAKEVVQNCVRFNKTCTGGGTITLRLKRTQKMESVQRKLDEYHEKYETLSHDLLFNTKFDALAYSFQNMEHIIRCLLIAQTEVADKTNRGNIHISRVAIDFFYDVLKSISDTTKPIEACSLTYSSIVNELGVFIQNSQQTEGLRILEMSLKRPELLNLLSEMFLPARTTTQNFLEMYRFLVQAHAKNHDKKIIFVLLSKFEISNWLQTTHDIKPSQMSELLKLILLGLEHWNAPESGLIQDIFRRHLNQMFEHNFPDNYLEILQTVLMAISEQKICTVVLLDLMNSLLTKIGCETLTLDSSKSKIEEVACRFAGQQNVLDFKTLNDTFNIFAQHFQRERFRNGLHGLYPKHKNFCLPLSMWFTVFSRTLVLSAISVYPGVLGDLICDSVFAPIISLYSPWIVIYKWKDLDQSTLNWIRQFVKGEKDLLPWDETNLATAQLMIDSFVGSLQFVLSNLPVSNVILCHIHNWYQHHFVDDDGSKCAIRVTMQNALAQLPWEKFSPQSNHIDGFYRILSESSAECNTFLAKTFVRIQWARWLTEQFYVCDSKSQHHIINLLLPVFIQNSLNPAIKSHPNLAQILDDALQFPWNTVDVSSVEAIFNWIILSVNPVSFLDLKSENSTAKTAVIKLLKVICGLSEPNASNVESAKYKLQSKRALYVRFIVRMLHSCSSINDDLLWKTPSVLLAHQNILVELLNDIERVLQNEPSVSERESEGQNLVLEIVGSLQNRNQTRSKLFVDAIVFWQSKCNPGSIVLYCMLNSLGLCKQIVFNMYQLLEATLFNYFRFCPKADDGISVWQNIFARLAGIVNILEYENLVKGPYLLTLHVYIITKIQNMNTPGEKITFLQDLSQLLENFKTNESTESRLVLIWGAVITCTCKMLILTDGSKKTLLMIARQLHIIAKQSDGWGDSLLGAIGLRRENSFSKRKILFRCLSCVLFSLFPDQSGSECKESQEFTSSLNELINDSMNKSYVNHKQVTTEAIQILTKHKTVAEPEYVIQSVFQLINLFYSDNFIKEAQDVWSV